MAALRHRTSGFAPAPLPRDGLAPAFAASDARLASSVIGPASGLGARAGWRTATENDVNSLIVSQRLNRMETRLFQDLFDILSGCDAMIDFDGPMQASPVARLARQILLGGWTWDFAGGMTDRRVA
jgi:hypothetical protein